MVASDADGEDSRLLLEFRVEVLVAEAGLRCVDRRVEQLQPRDLRQRDRIEAGDGSAIGQRLGERQVPHSASRSRISLSRSTCERSSAMNSLSFFTR